MAKYRKGNNKSNRRRNEGNSNSGQSSGASFSNSFESQLNANPTITQNVANISYHASLGARRIINDGYNRKTNLAQALPGIMVFGYHPTYGISDNADSALNVTSLKFFSKTRQYISGMRSYDHTNLFMYNISTDSLFSFWANCQRVLNLVNVYSISNRYLPRHIITALGFDYDDIVNNQTQFKAWMNTYAKQISVFAVPRSCPLFARHMAMCSNIYVDEPSERAQIYAFKPLGYYVYDEISEPGKTMLKYKKLPTQPLTLADAQNILSEMVSALANSGDVALYSGDIAKAYEGNLWTIDGYVEGNLEAVYDPEMLLAIHNMDIQYSGWDNFDIKEEINANNDPYLIANPTCKSQGYDSHIFIDTTQDKTDPLTTMLITRFKVQPYSKVFKAASVPYPNHFIECKFRNIGTEVIESAAIYYLRVDDNETYSLVSSSLSELAACVTLDYDNASQVTFVTDVFPTFYKRLALLSKFNSAPLFKIWSLNNDGTKSLMWDIIGNVDTNAVIDEETLNNIHEAALLSLLGL